MSPQPWLSTGASTSPRPRRPCRPGQLSLAEETAILLRIYHQTVGNFFSTFLPTFARDVAALGLLAPARAHLLAAYGWLWGIAGSC